MKRFARLRVRLLVCCAIACRLWPAARAAELFPVNVAVHVDTRVSHGRRVYRFAGIPFKRTEAEPAQPVEQIARIAKEQGVDALVLADRARGRISWGLTPWSRLLKVTVEQGSVASYGAERYLAAIEKAEGQTGVLIVPGVECMPYYRWRGNPLRGLRLSHAYEHMMLIGLDSPEALAGIPPTAGGFGRLRFSWTVLLNVVFLALIVLGVRVWRSERRRGRLWGGLIVAVSVLAMIDAAPFLPQEVSPYAAPRRHPPDIVARYAADQGGLAFWAHPSARAGSLPHRIKDSTGVAVEVRPYPEVLTRTQGYHGFAVFNAGIGPARPGGEWDEALLQYCSGRRPWPVWGISECDYDAHSPPDGIRDALCVAWVRERTERGVLEALRRGRCYATREDVSSSLWAVDYRLETGEMRARSGETLRTVADSARLVVHLRAADAEKAADGLQVVVVLNGGGKTVDLRPGPNGSLVATADLPVPRSRKKSYVRALVCHNGQPILALNPIFLAPEAAIGAGP